MKYVQLLDAETATRRANIENWTASYVASGILPTDTVSIQIVFHIVCPDATPGPTDQAIIAQLDALNRDFWLPDYASEPGFSDYAWERFGGEAMSPLIRFCLAATTPSGNPTLGIVRVLNTKLQWGFSDSLKRADTGGSAIWNPAQYLNVWVAPLQSGMAGYAQLPRGPAAYDGIVIDPRYFFPSAVPAENDPFADYSLGRTLVHLVGSYLNLNELWNEEKPCSDDGVADTPLHNSPNFGKPTGQHISLCSGNPLEMTINLMDNTDDKTQYMFTKGQVMRMRAALASGGSRAGLNTSLPICHNAVLRDIVSDNRSGKIEADDEALSVQVYPNPASNGFYIVINSSCQEKVYAEIYGPTANRVDFDSNVFSAGESRVYVDARSWVPGLYAVRIHCGKESAVQKVVLRGGH